MTSWLEQNLRVVCLLMTVSAIVSAVKYLEVIVLQKVDSTKYLGVIISKDLKWNTMFAQKQKQIEHLVS